ncbi:hypothetical protein ACHAXN_009066 [Cyclotella atomus]
MGDCTLHLLIESKLISYHKPSNSSNDFHLLPSSHLLSADSTLVELTSLLSRTLRNNEAATTLASICVIDASYHPAKTITDIIRDHPDTSGPKSKTLQSMGWFPSGKLVILHLSNAEDQDRCKTEQDLLAKFTEWQSRHVLNEEEFVYNLPTSAVAKDGDAVKGVVQWTGGAATDVKLKPTDIFNAVQTRFDGEESTDQIERKANQTKRQKRRSEQQRHQRLDAILNNLKKSTKTSKQVRNMLIKSRSVGDKKLRMEDRFHLEIVRVDDSGKHEGTNEPSSYRFFSRQTTAGKVASSVASSLGQDRAAEFLVAISSGTEQKYRRLPNTISLHDAQRDGWLDDFDTVLIRVYMLTSDGDTSGPSKSVLDEESDEESADEINIEVETEDQAPANSSSLPKTAAPHSSEETASNSSEAQVNKDQDQIDLQNRIQSIFQLAEAGEIDNKSNPNKGVKKKKPVSQQVHNMLIKSKASGDRKVKQEDRVYLEVIVFEDNNEVVSSSLSASYWFFEKRKTIAYVIESLDVKKDGAMVEFIVSVSNLLPGKDCSFQVLPVDLTLASAMKDKLLDNFGRVIVRVWSKRS